MILLVGLGNPGEEYAMNRHNVGFMFLDWLKKREEFNTDWKYDKYLLSDIIKGELTTDHSSLPTLFAKPQTFMNRSGDAVKKLLTTNHSPLTTLFVAHDDLDMTLGNFKIQNGTGPKMHNGISSIEESLGTSDFWRIRIGVDNRNPDQRIPGETYVLQNFLSEEMEILTQTFEKIVLRFHETQKNL